MDTFIDNALMWFRRDLRATDNAALFQACKTARRVWCVFVLDSTLLDDLPRADRRVDFIRESLDELDATLRELGASGAGLHVLQGDPIRCIPELAKTLQVQAVFANHDDEPQALARDAKVRGELADAGIALHTSKDHVIFERSEILTLSGKPYSVFTPYKNAWLKKIEPFYVQGYPVEKYAKHLAAWPSPLKAGVPSLEVVGFEPTNLRELGIEAGTKGAQALLADFLPRMDAYDSSRDFPAVKGPSYLSVHLRFGTVSIRELAREAWARAKHGSRGAQTWLSELIWRDFYHQVLHHHPHVVEGGFKPEYDHIRWEKGAHAEGLFKAWCAGETGYPLVDAAMAQINQTGYMHNRLRMVVASFLTKDLGIDWRWGERYFAIHLNDFDLAANNGGWQWASSSGCDAQPYFRIFNPVSQSKKFDPHGKFIRRYLPQLASLSDDAIHAPWTRPPGELAQAGVVLGENYPRPLVDHDGARRETLARYAVVKTAKT